ncbi:MAG: hemolysin family protein [Elusimicrobia bacterium]|nr:hemolysin family protein [Candidatus Liberimonas magnetica]
MNVLIVKLSLFCIFLLLVAFFSAIETALTSLSPLNLKNLKAKYPLIERQFLFWETRPNELLVTILIGINMAIIGSGVLSTSIAIDLSEKYSSFRHTILAAVPIISTILILVWCEIIPKIFSRYRSETVASFGITYLALFKKIFTPVSDLLLEIAKRIITYLTGQQSREIPFLRPEELKILLSLDDTPLSSPARKIMNNILDFGKTRISRVMIPREHIQAVNLEGDVNTVIKQIIEKGYSRVPVYRKDLDNIVGIIYSKDLNLSLRSGSLFLLEDLIRPVYFVPESARIDKVLREFKTGHQHLAVVVNEFGTMVGLATIEDLVEEIVGDIWDEYDIQEKTIFPLPDGFYILRANELLEKVNDELKLSLPSREFTTVSGWVLDLFGRIPKVGETITWGDVKLEIADATKKKITKVKIKKLS